MRYNRYLYWLPVQAVSITDIVKNSISSADIVTNPIIGASLESMYMCMGKNNNGLINCRLINATILYLLTTVLYFPANLPFHGRYSTVFVFDPLMQNIISYIINNIILLLTVPL